MYKPHERKSSEHREKYRLKSHNNLNSFISIFTLPCVCLDQVVDTNINPSGELPSLQVLGSLMLS